MDLLANGVVLSKAAPKAGMFLPEAALFMTRPDVKRAIADIRAVYLLGELQPLALLAARDILSDDDTAPAVRAKLSVAVLALTEKMQADTEGAAPSVDEMSPEELMSLAAGMRDQLEVERLTIEHDPQPISPAETENALF